MTIFLDGKALATMIKEDLKHQVAAIEEAVIFHIVYVGSDPVIDNYLRYKEKFARDIGVVTKVHRLSADVTQQEAMDYVASIVEYGHPMIIQLPLPEHLDTPSILDVVPAALDVDVLGGTARLAFSDGNLRFIPPVTASILEVFRRHNIELSTEKNITLVGNGKLVGQPTAAWLRSHQIHYKLIERDTPIDQRDEILAATDILITGVGIPGLITKDQLKEGVIVIDAGTSESGRQIQGDVDPEVASIASFFTPVPGGIGPLTIALLYRNVVTSYLHV